MKIVIYHLPTLTDLASDPVLSKSLITVDEMCSARIFETFHNSRLEASFPAYTKGGLSLCSADVITRVVRRIVSVKPSDTLTPSGTILGTYPRQLCSKYLRKR